MPSSAVRTPLLLTLAWRNLWRHRRRTLVLGSAIAFVGMSVVLLGLLLQSRYSAAKGQEGLL